MPKELIDRLRSVHELDVTVLEVLDTIKEAADAIERLEREKNELLEGAKASMVLSGRRIMELEAENTKPRLTVKQWNMVNDAAFLLDHYNEPSMSDDLLAVCGEVGIIDKARSQE